jgi:mono/diheme cytochrome c family protein
VIKTVDAAAEVFLPWAMREGNSIRHSCLRILSVCIALLLPVGTGAQERALRLSAPAALMESGLMDHLRPRFSLKTGVKIEIVPEGQEADIVLGPDEGRAVFEGAGTLWRMHVVGAHPGAARFAEWLTSEIGQRTVTSYTVAGQAPFSLPEAVDEAEAAGLFDGDAAEGRRISLLQCGRCHVVSPEHGTGSIGSTPSFAVLRALPDWDSRFQSFYALKPHPAFTQITGVTPPFAANRPPPIVPVEVTVEEVQAILAFVAGLSPADLGAPIQVQ